MTRAAAHVRGALARTLLTAALLSALAGCGAPEDRRIVKREGQADVVRFEADDPEMSRAIAEARRTFPHFLAALRAGKETHTRFAVKQPFREGEEVEHMWVTELSYDGSVLSGTLDNDPHTLRNLKEGRRVEVAVEEISDWMYVEEGKLVGGYTMRVMASRYTAEEKRGLEEELGFRID